MVRRVRRDARKAQEFANPFDALRELLIYFGENGIGMNQDATRRPEGVNRRNNVTGEAPAARAAA